MTDLIIWSPGVTLEHIERQVIEKALAFYKGNKSATASALAVAVRTLDRKIELYAEADKAAVAAQDRLSEDSANFLNRQRYGTLGGPPSPVMEPPKPQAGLEGELKPVPKAVEKDIDQPPAPMPKAAGGRR